MVPFFGGEILFEIGCDSNVLGGDHLKSGVVPLFFWGGGRSYLRLGVMIEIGCGSIFWGGDPV